MPANFEPLTGASLARGESVTQVQVVAARSILRVTRVFVSFAVVEDFSKRLCLIKPISPWPPDRVTFCQSFLQRTEHVTLAQAEAYCVCVTIVMDLGDGWLSCAPKPAPPKTKRPKQRQTILLKKPLVKKATAKRIAAFSTDNDYDDFQAPKERKPKRKCAVQSKISFKSTTSKPSSSKSTGGPPITSHVSQEETEQQHDVDQQSMNPAEVESEDEAARSDMPSAREAAYRLDTTVGDAPITRNMDAAPQTRTSQRTAFTCEPSFEKQLEGGAASTQRDVAVAPENRPREFIPDPQHDSPIIFSAEPHPAVTCVSDGLASARLLHGETGDPGMITLSQDSQPVCGDCHEQHHGVVNISSQESTFSVVQNTCESYASSSPSSAVLHFAHCTHFGESDAPGSSPLSRYILPHERDIPEWGTQYSATQSQDLVGLPDTQQLLEEDEEYMRRKRAVQSGLEDLPSVASLKQFAQRLAGQNTTLA